MLDDELPDVGGEERAEVDVGGVLRGDDDGVQPDRAAARVLDGDLGLSVGAEIGDRAVLAHLGQPAGEPVRQLDGQRHEIGGLVGRVTEHQALVARALLVEFVGRRVVDAPFVRDVDALGDVGGLGADGDGDAAGGAVETLHRRVVPDLQDLLAHECGDRRVRGGGHLAGDMDLPGGDQRLDGDPGGGVLAQEGVENGVTDLVCDLVGVALGHGLRGEQAAGHVHSRCR